MSSMSVKTFIECAKTLPKDISVLLRGETGTGKSQITFGLGAHFQLPVIDRRMSQMSEGDMIGLPSTDGCVTRFNPPDWYKRACDAPHMLFLDELNRASVEVMQAAFQIVLDRELNGWKLHPDTRVYCAINTGSQYSVNEVDPALLRRFWVIDLNPTTEDWIRWAKGEEVPIPNHPGGKLNEYLVEFIQQGEKWLDPAKNAEPGEVQPTRHSWQRLDYAHKVAGVENEPNNPLFYSLALGFVGTEATIAYHGYVKNIDHNVTAEEILDGYAKVQKKIAKMGQEKWNILVERVAEYTITLEKVTTKQGKNLESFIKDLPAELRINLWMKLVSPGKKKLPLIKSMHKYIAPAVLDVFGVPYGAAGVNVIPNIPDCLKDKLSG